MRIFSTQPYETQPFNAANESHDFELQPIRARLAHDSLELTEKADVVCVFVNDVVNAAILEDLARTGTKCVALRCAGFNNVDLEAAQRLGIKVVRVPSYSPNAVAEHTLALILALNRNIHRGYNRVRDRNFSLHGLVGFDLKGACVRHAAPPPPRGPLSPPVGTHALLVHAARASTEYGVIWVALQGRWRA